MNCHHDGVSDFSARIARCSAFQRRRGKSSSLGRRAFRPLLLFIGASERDTAVELNFLPLRSRSGNPRCRCRGAFCPRTPGTTSKKTCGMAGLANRVPSKSPDYVLKLALTRLTVHRASGGVQDGCRLQVGEIGEGILRLQRLPAVRRRTRGLCGPTLAIIADRGSLHLLQMQRDPVKSGFVGARAWLASFFNASEPAGETRSGAGH